MVTSELPERVDVVVVGSGVAGNAGAILLAKAGLSVVLLDRRREVEDYKLLCTHFVQPFANSVFADLGLERLLDAPFGMPTKAAFRVPGGAIDLPGGYGADPTTAYAHNLERRLMDPEMRREAQACGVVLAMGVGARALSRDETGAHVLDYERAGRPGRIACRFLVAADGRNSTLAKLVEAPAALHPNDRAAFFAYARGIPAPAQDRSLFALHDGEMSFLYPLVGGRTLLSVYVKRERMAGWGSGDEVWPHLLAQFERHLPELDYSRAERESRVFGYRKYDNQIRPPVTRGVAFLGDASISIDPMSGVGCSFALKSARLLADAILAHRDEPERALAAYAASHHAFFPPHVAGVVADARVAKTEDAVAETYSHILRDEKLQARYLALTARLITPAEFQKSYLVSVARGLARKPAPPAAAPQPEVAL